MQRGWMILGAGACLAAAGCKPLPEADEHFNDALVGTFVSFDAEDAVIAPYLRDLEEQVYTSLDLSGGLAQRALAPERLVADNVSHLEPRPDDSVDPADALAVATVHASPFEIPDHATIPVLEDQRPLEPTSPQYYDREFLAGRDCWTDRGCSWLQTRQDLTKEYTANIVPPVTYAFYKDFRWVDMNADAEDGTDPRWAYIARSWNDDTYCGKDETRGAEACEGFKGNILWQSYTIEVWIPRDGRGYIWEPKPEVDTAPPPGGDSRDGGTLRLLSLWTQTTIPLATDEATEVGTIRWGMDQNFSRHDKWLSENAE